MLRRGARILQFKRQINHQSCQFEYQDNCEIVTLTKGAVLDKINKGELVVTSSLQNSGVDLERSNVFFDLSSLTESERRLFERRVAYVKGLRKRGISKGQRQRITKAILDIAETIEDKDPPKTSAVMNWMRDFEHADDNPYVLVTRRRLRAHSSPISTLTNDLITNAIQTLYLTRERRTVRDVSTFVKGTLNRMKKSNQIPEELDGKFDVSERTIHRRVKQIDPFERDRKRLGETYARNKWRYSLNSEVAIHPLQRVEVDHTQLDIYVIDERLGILLGRPWITVIVDRYSGYILGFYVSFSGPGIQAALGGLKAAIRPKGELVGAITGIEHQWLAEGVAGLYVFDNGLEFQSRQFRDVIQHELRSEMQFCAVRSPWLKPAVERAIGLFNQQAIPRSGHTFGMESWSEFNPTKHAAISFSELCQILVRWSTDIHPFAVNDRKLARPYDLFAEGLATTPIPPFLVDYDRLDFVVATKRSCTVNREGVAFDRLQYNSKELKDLMRPLNTSFQTYMKFDREDLGAIHVQDPKTLDWIHVPCTRPDYAVGLSQKQHDEIKRFRREKLNTRHDIDGYIEALLKFQEHIQSLVGRRRSVRGAANLAKFAALTSAKVLAGKPQSILDSKASRMLTKDELTPAFHDVPNFEVSYAD